MSMLLLAPHAVENPPPTLSPRLRLRLQYAQTPALLTLDFVIAFAPFCA